MPGGGEHFDGKNGRRREVRRHQLVATSDQHIGLHLVTRIDPYSERRCQYEQILWAGVVQQSVEGQGEYLMPQALGRDSPAVDRRRVHSGVRHRAFLPGQRPRRDCSQQIPCASWSLPTGHLPTVSG